MAQGRADVPDGGVAELTRALRRLRTALSVRELLDRAPVELGSLGFTRTLVSRVHQGTWLPECAFARDDSELAQELVAAGRARPRALDRALLETDMLRQRRPMLVADPRTSPRTHQELVHLVDTEAYVAAPIVINGAVALFVHADKNADAGSVSPTDRQLVGAFAEGLGLAFEATIAADRLRALRREITADLRGISDRVDAFPDRVAEPALDLGTGTAEPDEPEPTAADRSAALQRAGLSSRERDVLRAMAEGKTNAQVASCLFVSETTVKYHVGNVLRKLDVANRAEAVAHFYRARPID